MVKARRSVKFMVEKEREIILRSRSVQQRKWCGGCNAEVVMASVDVAAREAGLGELAIYRLVDIRSVHFTQDSEGRVLICLNALLKQLAQRIREK